MKRALVTGAAGFIGSHLVDRCVDLGLAVTAVDDLSGGFRENLNPAADFRQGSVTDKDFVHRLWDSGRFDFVYHLAAYAAEGLSHFIRRYNYQTNLVGAINLINEAVLNDVSCFVFASSIAVYGAAQIPMTEETTPIPEDPYGISKYAVELDLAAAHHMFGLPYIIFRPHNVYGERQNISDTYRNVIGIFMNQLLSGKPMTVFGDGLQTRAFTYVGDISGIMARSPQVPEAYQGTFNIGADHPYAVLELAHEVGRALGIDPEILHLPPRNEVVHAIATHKRLQGLFGDEPSTSLADGLARMAAWIKDHGPMTPVTFDDIEVPVNLPPSWVVDRRGGPLARWRGR